MASPPYFKRAPPGTPERSPGPAAPLPARWASHQPPKLLVITEGVPVSDATRWTAGEGVRDKGCRSGRSGRRRGEQCWRSRRRSPSAETRAQPAEVGEAGLWPQDPCLSQRAESRPPLVPLSSPPGGLGHPDLCKSLTPSGAGWPQSVTMSSPTDSSQEEPRVHFGTPKR
ncbi:PREDICTED: uncharacterized protein LOC101379822 [Odobenus rosmarus divergens]|uniref:Uncharacterized protein LOC101379822 n=1 Tax=Odobenus rosmarus divergens TaxID=9708 RepID=A0A9B0GTN4_ODORO